MHNWPTLTASHTSAAQPLVPGAANQRNPDAAACSHYGIDSKLSTASRFSILYGLSAAFDAAGGVCRSCSVRGFRPSRPLRAPTRHWPDSASTAEVRCPTPPALQRAVVRLHRRRRRHRRPCRCRCARARVLCADRWGLAGDRDHCTAAAAATAAASTAARTPGTVRRAQRAVGRCRAALFPPTRGKIPFLRTLGYPYFPSPQLW